MKNFLKKMTLKQKLIVALIIVVILDILDFTLGKLGVCVLFRGEFFCLKLYAFTIVTYKFLNILTNNDKYISKFGTFFLCFSSPVLARINFDLVTLSELFIIFLNKYFDNKNVVQKDEKSKRKNIIFSIIGMILSTIAYVLSSDFSLQFPLIYLFIGLAIWTILKQDKKYWKNSFGIGGIALVVLYVIYFLIGKYTNLYVSASSSNIATSSYLFSFPYSFLMPYTNYGNKVLYYSLLHLFPLPLIMAGIYSFKNDDSKHDSFFITMMAVTVFEIVMTLNTLPNIVKTHTGFAYSNGVDVAFAIGLLNLYILYYMWSNVKEKLFKKKSIGINIVLALVVITNLIPNPFFDRRYLYLFVAITTALEFLAINYTNPKYIKAAMWLFTILTIWGLPALFI